MRREKKRTPGGKSLLLLLLFGCFFSAWFYVWTVCFFSIVWLLHPSFNTIAFLDSFCSTSIVVRLFIWSWFGSKIKWCGFLFTCTEVLLFKFRANKYSILKCWSLNEREKKIYIVQLIWREKKRINFYRNFDFRFSGNFV